MMRSHFNPPMTAPPDDDDKLPNLAPTDRATLGTGHARRRTMEIDIAERVGVSPRLAP
jgi:hypothetical protein